MKLNISNEQYNLTGIYKITNHINQRAYIDSTINFYKRYKQHVNQLSNKSHYNSDLQKDINDMGLNNFSFSILELVQSEYDLAEKEWQHIQKNINNYNNSDPREEYIKSRIPKVDTARKRESTEQYNKNYMIDYLNFYYFDKIEKLNEKLEKGSIYLKKNIDRWFLSNIKDDQMKNDDRLQGILNEWYKQYFCVTHSKLYAKELEVKHVNDFIVLSKRIAEDINIKKFKKERKKKVHSNLKRKKLNSIAFQADVLCKYFEHEVKNLIKQATNNILEKSYVDEYLTKSILDKNLFIDLRSIEKVLNKFYIKTQLKIVDPTL